MKKTCVLSTLISMNPKNIKKDKKYKEFLFKTLQEKKDILNSVNNGYILNIKKILNYNNYISPVSSDIIFTVTFLAECLMLKKGLKLDVNVKMIISHGILCNFKNIKIWIPNNKINGYKFKSSIFEKDDDQIKINDKIQVKLVEIRYEKNIFSCIASLT